MVYSTNADVYRVTKLSNSEVTTADVDKFIEEADEFIDGVTEQRFNTATSKTEYFSGESNEFLTQSFNTTTSRDIQTKDWNQGAILAAKNPYHKDQITTSRYPITSVDRIYFLDRTEVDISKVFSDDGGSFTDNTTVANSIGGTAFNIFAATPAVNDALYIGSGNAFEGLTLNLGTLGTDAGSLAVTWEYYNGSTWATLTSTDGTAAFTASGDLTFTAPLDWSTTTVNSSNALYYIRARLSAGSYTAVPTLVQTYMIDVIRTNVNMRDIQFESWGQITFMQNPVPNGTKNIKVVYNYGHSAVPKNVRELSASIAGCAALFAMIGGSFNDVTAYTIPEMSVSKGEPYTNMRAAIIELQKKIWGSPPGERGKHQIGLIETVGKAIKFEVS